MQFPDAFNTTMTQTTFLSSASTPTMYSASVSTTTSQEVYYEDEYDWENPESVTHIQTTGIVPVAYLGTLGNIIALIVWTAETRYNATTLLLKHLCVWDSLFLLMYATVIVSYEEMSEEERYAAQLFIALFQLMSVHLTLAAIVTRLVAVTRPLVVHDVLTRCRVYVVYVVMIVWCLLLVSLETVAYKIEDLKDMEQWSMFVSGQVIGLILPHVALLVSNVFLFYFLRRPRNVSDPSLQTDLPDTNTKDERSLTVTVISMSVCSLIAYPAGVSLKLLMEAESAGLISSRSSCDWECSEIAERVFHLLQVLNSSINIIFYLAFSTRFRQLGLHRCRCVCCLGRSQTTSSSMSSSRRSTETPGL
ncbi:hypothetical protein C0Q70_02405 [Pomacea canaliculata]|uniref:G-protein coupled receptors family 1 profile domain-containing protein n=1 Tax=Pomacea canaliculata TaxID=400727 RepID=A0A2T7PPT9_POMCA|nr:hypothetical protein C0Q70_02405 [Pomacea canaliculata]